jgi:hypothetical protein
MSLGKAVSVTTTDVSIEVVANEFHGNDKLDVRRGFGVRFGVVEPSC